MLNRVRSDVQKVNKYVSGKTMDEVMRAYGLTSAVKLGSNENNYAPVEGCKEAMISEIGKVQIYPEKNFVYLKKLLGEKFGLTEDNICLGHGAGNIIDTVAKTFIEPGDESIITKEAYHLYNAVTLIMGGVVKFVNVDANYVIDLDDVEALITDKTKVIWLCNPNNPTGTIFPKERFDAFMKNLPPHVVVVLDEAYVEYADKDLVPDTMRYVKEGYNLIAIRTFSKYYGIAGQRIGYAVASKEMCTIIDTVSMPFSANRMGLAAAVACLTNAADEILTVNNQLIADRGLLEDGLTKLGCTVVPSQANFILFKLPCDGDKANEMLLQRGVIVRPAKGWGFKDCIRVTVGRTEECAIFLDELRQVIASLIAEEA